MNRSLSTSLDILLIFSAYFILAFLAYPSAFIIGTDGVSYALLAQSIANGDGLKIFGEQSLYFSPMFSFFIVPFYWLLDDIEFASRVTIIMLGLGTLILFYYFLMTWFSRSIAFVATLLLATNTLLVSRVQKVSAQPLATFLGVVLFGILLFFSRIDVRKKRAFALAFFAGAVSGALYLTRPEYVLVILPVSLYLYFHGRKASVARGILHALFAFFAYLCFLFPNVWYLHHHTGEWTIIPTNRLPDAVLVDVKAKEDLLGLAPSTVLHEPQLVTIFKRFGAPSFWKFYLEQLLSMHGILVQLFGLFGIAFLGVGLHRLIIKKEASLLFAVLTLLSPMLVLALGHDGTNGYVLPFIPFLTVLVAYGCVSFSQELSVRFEFGRRAFLLTLMLSTAVCVALVAFPHVQNILFRPPAHIAKEQQLFGDWFREQVSEGTHVRIYSRKPEYAFYAGVTWGELGEPRTAQGVLERVVFADGNYLVLDTRSLGRRVDEWVNENGDFVIPGPRLLGKLEYYGELVYLYDLSGRM